MYFIGHENIKYIFPLINQQFKVNRDICFANDKFVKLGLFKHSVLSCGLIARANITFIASG